MRRNERNTDDLIREQQALAAGPTPLPATATMSTPSSSYLRPTTPTDIWSQAFQPMTVAAHQQYGLQQTQQWNATNPAAMVGPAAVNMMNMANMAPMRSPFATPSTALMTTPGMTGMFSTPADIAAQRSLMSSAAFLDPRTAAANLSSQRAEAWGQKYGGAIGMVAGTIGGGMLTGGMGSTVGKFAGEVGGGMLGGWVGEQLGNIPGIKQFREYLNKGVAENLSWMAQAQHGTVGRVSMGSQDIGLGGRGLNMESSMRLGQKLKGMSEQTGGMFNQMDMMNLTQSAGDAGLLDAATNIDQIANTVGSLMKVIGRLGKLTGDPDFRNNIRELGNLKQMGFTVDQAIDAIADTNRYARGAGMTRGQMGATMEAGAARAIGAGVTGGVGAMSAMIGAQRGRMLAGAFDPVQANLMGGTPGISQTIEEGRTAFVAQTSKLFIPSLLTIGENGEISLDQDKMRQLGGGGAINMNALAAHGQQNLHRIAQQKAQQTGQPIGSVLGDLMGRMPEFQSKMSNIMEGQIENVQTGMILGMRDTYGEYAAARVVMGSEAAARIKIAEQRDPGSYKRRVAQFQQDIEGEEGADRLAGMGRARQFRERSAWYNRAGRGISKGAGLMSEAVFGGDENDDWLEALDETRRMENENLMRTTGLKRTARQRLKGSVNERVVQEIVKTMRSQEEGGLPGYAQGLAGDMGSAGRFASENEMIAFQRLEGTYDTWGGTIDRGRVTGKGFWGNVIGGSAIINLLADDVSDDAREQETIKMRGILGEASKQKSIIERGMRLNFKERSDMQRSFMKEFDRAGFDGAALLTVVKNKIVAKAAMQGQAGGGMMVDSKDPKMKRATMMGAMREAFDELGMDGGDWINKKENVAFMGELGTSFITHSGDIDAKGSLNEMVSVGNLFDKYNIAGESIDDLRDAMQDESLSLLYEKGGIEWEKEGSFFGIGGIKKFETVAEQKAFGYITQEMDADVTMEEAARRRTAYTLMGQAKGGTDYTIMGQVQGSTGKSKAAAAAETQLRAMTQDKEYDKAREWAEKELGKRGGDVIQAVGRMGGAIAGLLDKKPGEVLTYQEREAAFADVTDLTSDFSKVWRGGEQLAAFKKEQGLEFTPGDAGSLGAPGGTPEAKRAADLKQQLEVFKEMRGAWVGPGSIGEDMKETTKYLQNTTVHLADAIDKIDKIIS